MFETAQLPIVEPALFTFLHHHGTQLEWVAKTTGISTGNSWAETRKLLVYREWVPQALYPATPQVPLGAARVLEVFR